MATKPKPTLRSYGDIKRLDEVAVTALNIERSTKALHSSVTQIDGDNFTANALAGRVAGMNVTKIASGPAGLQGW